MILELPDHYAQTLASALVVRGADVIKEFGYVPAFLSQYADIYDKVMDQAFLALPSDFWSAISLSHPHTRKVLKHAGHI